MTSATWFHRLSWNKYMPPAMSWLVTFNCLNTPGATFAWYNIPQMCLALPWYTTFLTLQTHENVSYVWTQHSPVPVFIFLCIGITIGTPLDASQTVHRFSWMFIFCLVTNNHENYSLLFHLLNAYLAAVANNKDIMMRIIKSQLILWYHPLISLQALWESTNKNSQDSWATIWT